MKEVDYVLEHFGVKGMRWGVRKSRGGVTILGRRSAKPTPSEDKVAANTARAKISKRGNTDALTNKEMQTLVTRMNLEQNLTRLSAGQKKGGVGAVITKILKDTAKEEFQQFSQGKQGKVMGTAIMLSSKGRHRKA